MPASASKLAAVALMVVSFCAAEARAIDLEELDNSVVRVVVPISRTESSIGTGFVINDRGNVVTNLHVIAQAGATVQVIVKGRLREPLTARVIVRDRERDLAVLEVAGLKQPVVPLSLVDPTLGDRVYAFGYPGIGDRLDTAQSATLNTGAISRVFTAAWGPDTRLQIRLLQHEAAINPGNSGGPLFNACGEVIGVNTQTSPSKVFRDNQGNVRAVVAGTGIYFSSHASELAAVLRAQNIPFTSRNQKCAPETAAGVGLPGWALPSMVAWSAGATVIAIVALVFAMRRPRERIVRVVGGASRVIARSFKVGSAASGRQSAGKMAGTPEASGSGSIWGAAKPASRPPPAAVVDPQSSRSPLASSVWDAAKANARASGARIDGWRLTAKMPDAAAIVLTLDAARLRASARGLVLGRHDELSDLVIAHPNLSRRHVRFSLQGETLMVEDLNSANGTSSDGIHLQPFQPTAAGAQLVLGDVQLEIARG